MAEPRSPRSQPSRRCVLCRSSAPQPTLTRLHWRGRWRRSGRQRTGRGRYLCAGCVAALRADDRKALGLLTRSFGTHAAQVRALFEPLPNVSQEEHHV